MKQVKDVMDRSVVSLDEGTSFKEIVRRMDSLHASSLPVVDTAGHLLGVVSEAELLPRQACHGAERGAFSRFRHRSRRFTPDAVVAASIMDTRADTVGAEDSVAEAARLMCDKRVIRLPVVEEDGRVTGTVTWRDLLSVFMRSDRVITEEIDRWIRSVALLEPFSVRATVREGVVTLEGQLENPSQLQPLLGFVRSVDGVVRVVNRLSFPKEIRLVGESSRTAGAFAAPARPTALP